MTRYDERAVRQQQADRQAMVDGGLFSPPGICGSCGRFPAAAGTICSACAAVPGNGHEPEHVGSILTRVMADILSRTTKPTTEVPR